MKHIRVGDLMTDEVVSVVPATSFKEVAKLLAQYNISGLPVLDDEDQVVGVVSESDLVNRQAARHLVPSDGPDAGDRDRHRDRSVVGSGIHGCRGHVDTGGDRPRRRDRTGRRSADDA